MPSENKNKIQPLYQRFEILPEANMYIAYTAIYIFHCFRFFYRFFLHLLFYAAEKVLCFYLL